MHYALKYTVREVLDGLAAHERAREPNMAQSAHERAHTPKHGPTFRPNYTCRELGQAGIGNVVV